jgi:SAM-dependent methyltransferase
MTSKDSDLDHVYGASSPAEIRAVYQDWAARYDEENLKKGFHLPTLGAGFLARYLPRGEGPILDAGCGTGLVGHSLSILGYDDLEGMDLSEAMLAIAAARGVYGKLTHQELGKRLDEPDGRFAAACCFGSFGPGHAPPETLEELVRVVRPGGPIVFNVVAATYVDQGFETKMTELSDLGLWREEERSPPFRPFLLGEPELFCIAFAFRKA